MESSYKQILIKMVCLSKGYSCFKRKKKSKDQKKHNSDIGALESIRGPWGATKDPRPTSAFLTHSTQVGRMCHLPKVSPKSPKCLRKRILIISAFK